jgi:hypothetical protein
LADPTPDWSGSVSLAFNPADLLAADQAENSPGKYKVCSYARPGTRVGSAGFSGGGNLITLTAGGGSGFRTWAAGSRIDLGFDDWVYVYTVSAAVALPAAGQVTQTIPVSGTLPGVGNPLNGAAFADVWPYANISVPLVNQNYLVIRAGNAPAVAPPFTCPISTVAHQPAS